MTKICLTGGPCGGKSSIIEYIIKDLKQLGYPVYVCEESATQLMKQRISPDKMTEYEFQLEVAKKQLMNEKIIEKQVHMENTTKKAVIICDRGYYDQLAYISKNDFISILKEIKISPENALVNYDAVLHLMTAAKGAKEYYQWKDRENCNNCFRTETPDEAINKDNKTLNAWIGHPHLRVFDNSTDFDGKVLRVINEIHRILGIPKHLEIERKFLLGKPSETDLKSVGKTTVIKITQYYLKSNNDIERRIRVRENSDGGTSYFYTEKSKVKKSVRIENEKRISHIEFVRLICEQDPMCNPIIKYRHYFLYKGRYFEMDFYEDFPDENKAVLEVELDYPDDTIVLPPFNIIKDITNCEKYKNKKLSNKFLYK